MGTAFIELVKSLNSMDGAMITGAALIFLAYTIATISLITCSVVVSWKEVTRKRARIGR